MIKINKTKLFLFFFLSITIIYPLIQMLLVVEWSDFTRLIQLTTFKEALKNSLYVTSIATIFSLIIAYILAFTINRTDIKHKTVIKILLTLPMLIPSISHGLGLIQLFGMQGIISKIFDFHAIGSTGIIIGSIFYSFPIAFLMFDDGFQYIDNTMYDTAKVLGLNKWQTFQKVTMCYLKKTILSAVFATFTLIFTDYGVPLAIGGKFLTLPVFLYKEVIGLLDFSSGTIIGLFLLIPAFLSFIFDYISKDYSHFTTKEEQILYNSKRNYILKGFVYSIIICILIFLSSFLYCAFIKNITLDKSLSFSHLEYVWTSDIQNYIFNSLIISLFVSILGTSIAYMIAYITSRKGGKSSKILHMITILSLAIPGLVLGLSYTISFKESVIYNTFLILILVNMIHFLATPYLMAYNALGKVNENLEVVAKTCHIPFYRLVIDVFIPCTKRTIREMFTYFFMNSMITISAVTFLFNMDTMPLSLLITNYENTMMLGEAAIVSLIILIINLSMKLFFFWIDKRDQKRGEMYVNKKTI